MAIAPNSLAIPFASLLTDPAVSASTTSRVANSQIRSAVDTLNQTQSAGADREFSISIDAKTKQPVVRIVDSSTREVIDQIPNQSILDLAQEIDAQSGSKTPDSLR